MRNPNPKQLGEDTVQYYLTKLPEVNEAIEDLEDRIKKTKRKKKMKDFLAQWKYIKWRITRGVEKVTFT